MLRAHLKKVSSHAIAMLAEKISTVEWRNLATATLASIILFNRRRGGEPALLQIKDYQNSMMANTVMNDEIKSSLSQLELRLCEKFKRLEIRGKHGRKVQQYNF